MYGLIFRQHYAVYAHSDNKLWGVDDKNDWSKNRCFSSIFFQLLGTGHFLRHWCENKPAKMKRPANSISLSCELITCPMWTLLFSSKVCSTLCSLPRLLPREAADISASDTNFLKEFLSPLVTHIVTLLYSPYFC